MRSEPFAATAALILLGFSVFHGCGDSESGNQPTTVSSGPTGSAGSAGDGGSGASADGGGGTGGNPTGGGDGGMGGMPEQPIHGCLSTTAQSMTGMTTIMLGNPTVLTYPLCYTVSLNTVISVTNDGSPGLGDFLIVGGTYDGAIKAYDGESPIQPTCHFGCTICPFDPNSNACYTGGTWTFPLAGVFPFYNNSNPAAHAGVIYVVP